MGKRARSDPDDYEYIAKIVKKLNERLMRVLHKRRRRSPIPPTSSDSSSSSSSSSSRSASPRPRSRPRAQPTPTLTDALSIKDASGNPSGVAAPVSSTSATGNNSTPSTNAAPNLATSEERAAEPQPSGSVANEMQSITSNNNCSLSDALLQILGDDPSQQKIYGKDIQPDLAVRLQYIATSGLTKEARKELLDKYLPPGNCPLVDAPALNPEVKAAIPEAIYKTDKAIEQRQKQLSCVATCLAETITTLMTESKNAAIVQLLMDASKLLCDTLYSESITRRNVILNNIKKELKDQLQATKIDKLLFSKELSDALKAAKAISKLSADMKLTNSKNIIKKSLKPTKTRRAPPPVQGRPRWNQRIKEPAYRNRHEISLKQSSHPAQTRNRRR